ncbi:mRNA turnover protein 4-like protein [Laetiporus sulphureus 93-53]|uniref:Ribosome assembly factor mrt4 n=1 Tax=Laetiporus sulphureus 93-53 TaxID=1314785 RepID=A0A165FTH1_9APHY|nr:mRNA turnover protein 4-like protein [Laetiporus sulphureus 93-53]KZT09389.1 mRNA turnover protein 4-like protein [Laetiporus sulphureus 93-53]
MPKSKRSKVVSLTKVTKKTREHKNALLKEVQENADKWEYCWLFEVGNMRNSHLKTVRKLWKDSARMFFGRGAVMAKAIGTTPEEEYRMGLHRLAKQIKGQVGLFFTSTPPDEVIAWFDDFKQPDFARAGNTASRTVTLPAGPVMQQHSTPPEPFPHNEEAQLRKLGLRTKMQRGVPTLETPHTVCEEGKTLNAEQAQLLKLVGIKMVRFRVGLRARWEAANGEVVQLGETEIAEDEVKTGEEADGEQEQGEEADELMSE